MVADTGSAGRATTAPTQAPRDTVRVGALHFDRAPVTNERYAAFVAATGHRPPAYWPNGRCPTHLLDHPVVGVDLFDALAYAQWAGGRLPTELEWMSAAGTKEGGHYPWGETFDASRCNTIRSGRKGTTPVGLYPPAPSGCVDLSGNVWEMTCTLDPEDPETVVVKGGSWYDYPAHARLDARFRFRLHKGGATVGFRLVYGGATPAFLPAGLIERCIAFRRVRPEIPDAGADRPGEFDQVLADLRSAAESHLAGISLTAPAPLEEAPLVVDEALRFFDVAEAAPDTSSVPDPICTEPPPTWEDLARNLVDVLRTGVERHPRVVGAALGVAFLLVLSLAFLGSDADPMRSVSRAEPVRIADRAGPAYRQAGRRSSVAGGAWQKPSPVAPRADLPENALQALLTGKAEARERAEMALLENARDARPAIEDALRRAATPEAEASLRYVLAAMDDGQKPAETEAASIGSPPREGLVFFFHTLDASVDEEAAKARWTAQAERLPFTVVYTGAHSSDVVLRAFGRVLKGSQLYIDRDGELVRKWGVASTPAVAGLRRDGRLAFVHLGRMGRSRLAQEAGALARPAPPRGS